jgi:TolB protein
MLHEFQKLCITFDSGRLWMRLIYIGLVIVSGLLIAGGRQAQEAPAATRLTYVTMAYPNYHPNNSLIVFQANMGGDYDLYTLTLPRAERKALVVSPGNDITPVYAPDGKKIAFVSERTGNRDIFICDADGSNQVNVTSLAGNDIHPMWSEDGKRLIFSSNRGNESPDDFDIYTMDADGKNVRQITDGPDVDTYASWSPDGKQIVTRRVIEGNNEVFAMDAYGRNAKNLTNSPNYDGWPNWSPDGKWIVFSSGPEANQVARSANMRVHLMRPDGSERRVFSHPPAGTDWIYDTQPTFSHDGKEVAFARYRPGFMESSDIAFQRFQP